MKINGFNPERLIPHHVGLIRSINGYTFRFAIDGYIGEDSGEIYYKASEITKVEKIIKKTKEGKN